MMKLRPSRTGSKGFTLIELMIAVAVVAIIIMIAAPSFRDMVSIQRLRSVNSQLVTDLQFARNEAVARGVPLRVVFDPDGACYALFTSTGTATQTANSQRCDCLKGPGNACTGIPGTTEVRTVELPTGQGVFVYPLGVAAVAFDPATGGLLQIPKDQPSTPMQAFKVLTWLDDPRHLYNTLNQSGRPTVCSPPGTNLSNKVCDPYPP